MKKSKSINNKTQGSQPCDYSLQQIRSKKINTKKYSHYLADKLNQKQNQQTKLLSLFVQLPVYQQYMNIDLQKTTSYQRISRHKTKLNQSPKHNQSTLSQKNIKKSKLYENRLSSQVQNIQKQQKGWRSKVQKYIEVKQKNLKKQDQIIEGYPLMKLSKKNQRIRKVKTNQPVLGKPQIVTKLQTQQLFDQKSLAQAKALPKIVQIKKLRNTQSQRIQNKQQQGFNINPYSMNLKQQPNSKSLNSHSVKIQNKSNDKVVRKSFFKQVVQNANKSEKVLINFIGNYFRQKFCPQRRFSHQIPINQFKQQMVKLKIKNYLQQNK